MLAYLAALAPWLAAMGRAALAARPRPWLRRVPLP